MLYRLKFLLPLFVFFFISGPLSIASVPDRVRVYRVAITQIVEHPSLDAIRKGIIDELEKHGYTSDNLQITYDSAQGNIATAAQIAQRFVASFPDAIVAIATPSAQTAVNAVKGSQIPVIFGAVTDPISAKIVASLEKPTNNVTGTIDLPPTKSQLDFVKEVYPNLKKLGVLYNPGETNNVLQVAEIKKYADSLGIEIIESTPTKTSEVSAAAKSLIAKAEAILLPNDNTVVSALESVLKAAAEGAIPVFTSDPDSVRKGALAAIANNQYDVGRATGKIVAHILSGERASSIPVQAVQISKRYVNKNTAQNLGLTITADVIF